jgi:palmitoyltransferase
MQSMQSMSPNMQSFSKMSPMMDDKQGLRCISRVTMGVCIAIFIYLGLVYNAVFLSRALPASGKDYLVPILGVIFNTLLALTVWSYLRAHLADPGRLPNSWSQFVQKLGPDLVVVSARHEWQPGKATSCKKCNFPRPERSHHCTICQTCILRMDHHCPWIGNCVGFKNHKFFLLLAMYGCAGCFFGFVTVLPEVFTYAVSPLQQSFRQTAGADTGSNSSAAPYVSTTLTNTIANTAQLPTTTVPIAAAFTTAAPTFPPLTSVLPATTAFLPLIPINQPPVLAPTLTLDEITDGASSSLETAASKSETQGNGGDGAALFAFCVLSLMVALLLASLLSAHVPLALANTTTIEENYENMPNPFDFGGKMKNIAQVFGHFGPDWFLPVNPRQPLSDGVSYPRPSDPGEPLTPQDLELLQPEGLWRLRYATQQHAPEPEPMPASPGLFEPLTRWWRGGF